MSALGGLHPGVGCGSALGGFAWGVCIQGALPRGSSSWGSAPPPVNRMTRKV